MHNLSQTVSDQYDQYDGVNDLLIDFNFIEISFDIILGYYQQ